VLCHQNAEVLAPQMDPDPWATSVYSVDDDPPLHPVHAKRIPYGSWTLAGIESLPAGWCNVRIWSYDRTLNRDLFVTETCPGILYFESTVTETVRQLAAPDGSLLTQYGDPWDDSPVVLATAVVDPPHRHKQYADPEWKPAYVAGGYLGSCPVDLVRAVLTEHGFPEAIPRPDGWTADPDDAY